VFVEPEKGVRVEDISMDFEYSPATTKGSFRCNDEQLNRIWEVGEYTMFLTTREFFVDGIKRDRWAWSGDAIQSYLMNYYLFFDSDTVKRTIYLLRGKDPVTSHINTILDYTFYWFLSINDYYLYTGDEAFVRAVYPRMKSLMEFVLSRTNAEGMVEGLAGDWVFVDWPDGYLDKKGELSFEQVLFCRSLETMAQCSALAGEKAESEKYRELSVSLREKIESAFWCESKKALVHNRVGGVPSDTVTRYANMFAVLYGYLSPEKEQEIKSNVLYNEQVMSIVTPYMRFYELEALCKLGEQRKVLEEIKSYWGGMINEGATTFWEKYNPAQSGSEHYSMYNRPFGKSLCHAWGASPVYLLGRYYLGVSPTAAGYREFEIRPQLGGLEWMEGSVPTPKGKIDVTVSRKQITVETSEGEGFLYFESSKKPKIQSGNGTTVEALGGNSYRVRISKESGQAVVSYRNPQ